MRLSEKPDLDISNELSEILLQRRSRAVDKVQTAELVKRAMGSRSIRSFADELGCNASAISRITSGETAKISTALIARIAACASQGSGVTLQHLLSAQGFAANAIRGNTNEFIGDRRRIIVDEMVNHGFVVQKCEAKRKTEYSFNLLTNALSESHDKTCEWMFTIMPEMPTSFVKDSVIAQIHTIMVACYTGSLVKRHSLVVSDESEFLAAKDYLSKLVIPDEISVILVSIQEKCVVKEYVAPLKNEAPGDHQAIMKLGSAAEQ